MNTETASRGQSVRHTGGHCLLESGLNQKWQESAGSGTWSLLLP